MSDQLSGQSEEVQDYELLFLEQEIPLTQLDVRTHQQIQASFPNKTYGDLVILVSTYHLSDSAGNAIIRFFNKYRYDEGVFLPASMKQGRMFLDGINISHITFQKTPIMKYKNAQYFLYHRPIFDAIKELLSNKDIFQWCVFNYTPVYTQDDNRVYGEQFSRKWWERAQSSIPTEAKVISIILYSDAMTCDQSGKTNEHPVYLTLGNIPNWRRNRPDAKILLGYLPKFKSTNQFQKMSKSFQSAKLHLYQHAMDTMLKPLLECRESGFDLHIDNGLLWCFPFISEIFGDLPEHATLTLTFNSARCKYPCHKCLTPLEEFNNVRLVD